VSPIISPPVHDAAALRRRRRRRRSRERERRREAVQAEAGALALAFRAHRRRPPVPRRAPHGPRQRRRQRHRGGHALPVWQAGSFALAGTESSICIILVVVVVGGIASSTIVTADSAFKLGLFADDGGTDPGQAGRAARGGLQSGEGRSGRRRRRQPVVAQAVLPHVLPLRRVVHHAALHRERHLERPGPGKRRRPPLACGRSRALHCVYGLWKHQQVREMTVDQAAALMAPLEQAYRRNNRPTQPRNGRVVQVYRNGFINKKTAP
jgi:hypothetical protein